MSDSNSATGSSSPCWLVVFDAPALLTHSFLDNGFQRHGRQAGAWHRHFDDPASDEARDIEYELTGVGLKPRWWTPE